MKILSIHADYIEVEPKKRALKDAEELEDTSKKRYEEVLVVFTAVEEQDLDVLAISSKLKEEILKILEQVKAERVLLYPLVHLTSKPAPPRVAKAVLLKTENLLKEIVEVAHAPFGWYKGYTLKCKGHPLSELSREISLEGKAKEEVSESLKTEDKLNSRFYIMDLDGNLIPLEEYEFKNENLKLFAQYEHKKKRVYEKEPPHIKLMKEHGLIDYEPGSDSGNFRFLPKGRLIKKLLERHVTDVCVSDGALEVETPIMYDFEHPSLKKYLNRFPARQYVLASDKKRLFLRFAACFGQFLIAHDMQISYKNLPLKLFELTRYSFRREQSGELAGLKRLRAFTMPDMHTLVSDFDMAKKEFEHQYDLCLAWNEMLGLETEIGFRVQEDFLNENKEWYVSLVKKAGKPALFEIYKERYAYFITKFEFNFIDCMEKASSLSTVQIDVENAETYDISYVDESGEKRRPYILHASISGSLERVIYAMLEKEAAKIEKGNRAMWPLWLAPTQVRIIPISEEQVEQAKKIAEEISKQCVRVDVDDRNESLGKKIRQAQKEWIPYIAVLGKQEIEKGLLTVTVREKNRKEEYSTETLVKEIKEQTKAYPFEKLSLPMQLSKRPIISTI